MLVDAEILKWATTEIRNSFLPNTVDPIVQLADHKQINIQTKKQTNIQTNKRQRLKSETLFCQTGLAQLLSWQNTIHNSLTFPCNLTIARKSGADVSIVSTNQHLHFSMKSWVQNSTTLIGQAFSLGMGYCLVKIR